MLGGAARRYKGLKVPNVSFETEGAARLGSRVATVQQGWASCIVTRAWGAARPCKGLRVPNGSSGGQQDGRGPARVG